MGSVWLAEQTEPVRRTVALKLIKAGMDSRSVLVRFEAERQALALMDHPNIAKVLDAGATADGRPYIVMELVEGVPITKFCAERRLGPWERLELFVPVCQALQHAHQKGVIHRDLKPSNILVGTYDSKPVPRVIDFGVAKATGPRLTDDTLSTEVGALIGTLEYMSPEQADPNSRDVDTRSDVYALGVVLFELLTGSPPFRRPELERASLLEMLRIIREVDPPKPSTRLAETRTAEGGPTAGGTDSSQVPRSPRLYELDWIVMKCLEKDRDRRYESASALAADVQRYLADEPGLAGPPSAAYRVRKFLRRHRGPALAASLVLFALLGGIAGTTVGLIRARWARAEEKAAKETAEKRLVQIEKGIDVLGAVFDDLNPEAEQRDGRPLRAILGDRLDRAAAELDGEAVGDPLVVARLQHRLGQTFLGLGHAAKARDLFGKAAATRRALLGPDDPLTLRSLVLFGLAHRDAGNPAEAVPVLELVRDAQVRTLGADDPATLATRGDLGETYRQVGRADDAIAILEAVRDVHIQQHGPADRLTLNSQNNLAIAYASAGRREEAVSLLEQVLAARREQLGLANVDTVMSLSNLARAYQMTYRMRDAINLLEEARDAVVPILSADHPLTLRILDNLARMYLAYNSVEKATTLAKQVLEARTLRLGGYHQETISSLDTLSRAYQAARQPEKALPHFRQAATGLEQLGFMHPAAERIIDNICRAHEQLNQYGLAEGWRRQWVAAVRERAGPDSPSHATALAGLGANLVHQGKHADAEPILRECLALGERHPRDVDTVRPRSLLGAALLGQKNYVEAEPLLIAAYQGLVEWERNRLPGHHGGLNWGGMPDVLERLVGLYQDWGKPVEAAKWRKELDARRPPAPARAEKP